MNMFDEARSIAGMVQMRGMTQEKLGEVLGVSQSYIANKLRLLRFDEDAQEKIIRYGLSERHARALLRLPADRWSVAIERIHTGKMSVAESEILIDCLLEELEIEEIGEGENYADKVIRFERSLDKSLKNLRLFGIPARAFYEKEQERLLIKIEVG